MLRNEVVVVKTISEMHNILNDPFCSLEGQVCHNMKAYYVLGAIYQDSGVGCWGMYKLEEEHSAF